MNDHNTAGTQASGFIAEEHAQHGVPSPRSAGAALLYSRYLPEPQHRLRVCCAVHGHLFAHWDDLAAEEAGGCCLVSCAVPGWWQAAARQAQAGAGLGSWMSAGVCLLS